MVEEEVVVHHLEGTRVVEHDNKEERVGEEEEEEEQTQVYAREKVKREVEQHD